MGITNPSRRERRSGFSLIEVMTGITLLTFGFIGLASSLAASARAGDQSREDMFVNHALRRMAETLRASPFSETAVKYANYSFTVSGLISGTGRVRVFTNELDGSADAQKLGLPRDLDGDGFATKPNVLSSYTLLPVKIQITWSGRDGPGTRDLYMMLAQE